MRTAVYGIVVVLLLASTAGAQGAKPLSGNAYKVQMVKTAVKRAILAAVA